MISRAVANHLTYGHLASPLKVRQHVAQSLVLGRKRTRVVKIIHSAADEDDLWDVVYLTGPCSPRGRRQSANQLKRSCAGRAARRPVDLARSAEG